jgi:hypothetical protein
MRIYHSLLAGAAGTLGGLAATLIVHGGWQPMVAPRQARARSPPAPPWHGHTREESFALLDEPHSPSVASSARRLAVVSWIAHFAAVRSWHRTLMSHRPQRTT